MSAPPIAAVGGGLSADNSAATSGARAQGPRGQHDSRRANTSAATSSKLAEGLGALFGPWGFELRSALAIACVLAGLALVVLDAVIANVALPAIALSLHATPAAAVGVVTSYQMALVMTLLPCAAIAERFGYRRVYTAGVALFVGASAACAAAPSLELLIAARFIQGLGGAAIMALSVALLRRIVPQRQLGAAIGWNTLTVALSSAAGPTLGALVLSRSSWPWLFALNLPLGALVLVATRALPPIRGSTRELDAVSIALNATAFAALIAGAELLPTRPTPAACAFIAGVFAMLVLVRRELPKPAPIIPLDLLRQTPFRISVIASVCCFIGQSAALVALPFYLQHAFGLDVLHTGLLMTPWPLTVALIAPWAGRLADRISGAWLCALGGTLLALGLASLALWPLHADALVLIAPLMVCGAGFGFFQVANNRNLFLSAAPERSAAAGGMQSTARLTGQALGAVIMTLLFTLLPIDLAPSIGLGLGAALTLCAGLVSTLRAELSMRAKS